jgi:hypothetical protein
MGPLSSSHEKEEAEAHYRHYCRPSFKPPPAYLILFIGCPILLCVLAVGLIPWYYALLFMVSKRKRGGEEENSKYALLLQSQKNASVDFAFS